MIIEFYAYVHCKPDGAPFYVGKGHGRRAYRLDKRNDWHQRVVKKHGRENILVGTLACSSQVAAFELEKGIIKCLRRSGSSLTNLTDGGDGVAGLVVTQLTREKIALKLREHFSDPKNIERLSLQARGRRHSASAKQKVSVANKGKVVVAVTKQKTAETIQAWWDARHAVAKAALPEGTDMWCTTCKQPLPFESFGKDASQTNGYSVRCKSCAKAFTAKYRAARRAA